IWLDDLLPRVAAAATSDPHRASRVAACELLHGLTLWMIGKNAHRIIAAEGPGGEEEAAAKPTRFSRILGRLYPVMLSLAAGHDPLGRQLFGPLITSLVHWMT
ncbi:DNA dependent protein kinase catalytic subunit, partial [Monoraphidium neglectum]